MTRFTACRILGVASSATPEDIKHAFRKLAAEVHPDKNPNNPDAKVEFQSVNEAYQFLTNQSKPKAPPPTQPTPTVKRPTFHRPAFDPNSPQYRKMRKIASILLGKEKVDNIETVVRMSERVTKDSIKQAFDLLGIVEEEKEENT
jgi:hypothetical protein